MKVWKAAGDSSALLVSESMRLLLGNIQALHAVFPCFRCGQGGDEKGIKHLTAIPQSHCSVSDTTLNLQQLCLDHTRTVCVCVLAWDCVCLGVEFEINESFYFVICTSIHSSFIHPSIHPAIHTVHLSFPLPFICVQVTRFLYCSSR